MLTLKIKRLSEDAILPVQSTPGAGCWDVFASSDPDFVMREGECQYVEYETGLSFELPDGYDMLIFPRSSISSHTDLSLSNSVGMLDCLPIDAMIAIDFDKEVPLSELLTGKYDSVLSYNFENDNFEKCQINEIFKVGVKESFLVTLENGTVIKVTDNELIYTDRGWVKCKELTVDNKIAVMKPN